MGNRDLRLFLMLLRVLVHVLLALSVKRFLLSRVLGFRKVNVDVGFFAVVFGYAFLFRLACVVCA